MNILFSYLRQVSSLVLCVVISVCWCNLSYTAIVESYLVKVGDKKIYLFGSHHTAGTPEQNEQQVDDFIEALESTADLREERLQIYWEQASSYMKYHTKHKLVLDDLEEELGETDLDADIEDVEIRKVEITGSFLLSQKVPTPMHPSLRFFDDDGPILATLTFRDVLNSYRELRQKLDDFRREQTNAAHFEGFDERLGWAESGCKKFVNWLARNNISLDANISQFAQDCFWRRDSILVESTSEYYGKERILPKHAARYCNDIFDHIFEAYIFQRIYVSRNNEIAIFAGGAHVSSIYSMLRNLGSEKVICFRSPNEISAPHPHQIKILSKSDIITTLQGYSLSYTLKKFAEKVIVTGVVMILGLFVEKGSGKEAAAVE